MPRLVPEYRLTRKRMRNLRLRVVPPHGEIQVSAPHGTPQSRIDEFVVSRTRWIEKRRKAMEGLAPRLEPGPEADACAAVLEAWLAELVPLWCERFAVEPPRMTLRIMRSQWGSCRPWKNAITLNTELARRGRDLAEYVLVHELCHLFHGGHGREFYALMDAHLPDWRARRKRLGPL